MVARRLLSLNTDKLPVTPVDKLASNLMSSIILDIVSTTENWCRLESARPPYTIAQASSLARLLQFHQQRTEF